MTKHEAFADQLTQIRAATEKLNEAAHRASKLIDATEKAVVELDPGIRVYSESMLVDETDEHGREIILGFDKSEKKWGFVVREVIRDDDGRTKLSDEVTLLRKADREVRIAGAARLERLMNGIVAELNAKVANLPVAAPPVTPIGSVKKTKRKEKSDKAGAEAPRAASS